MLRKKISENSFLLMVKQAVSTSDWST